MSVNEKMTAIADAIRGKTGGTELLTLDGMATAIAGIETGGGGVVTEKDVNFYDYDGTLLHSYTVEEAQALTELPELPTQEGLICQGWNWTLESIKERNRAVNVGAMYITDDGKTRIYIHLEEERKSPMLCCGINGTVTVDWGDGTEPDVLTGAGLAAINRTTHEYASGGDYVITLTADGEVGFGGSSAYPLLRHSTNTQINAYLNAIKKVEIGANVTLRNYTFSSCFSLAEISIASDTIIFGSKYIFQACRALKSATIPDGVTVIDECCFDSCYSMTNALIPASVTSAGRQAFGYCYSLTNVAIPNNLVSFGASPFHNSTSLKRVTFSENATEMCSFSQCSALQFVNIPEGVTALPESVFRATSIERLVLHEGITSIGGYAFYNCSSLSKVVLPQSLTSLGAQAFYGCSCLTGVAIPSGVTSIAAQTFAGCRSLAFVDFSTHTAVPTLENTNAFTNTPADCEIRVPAALYDEWIAATNWATLASQIVAV